MQNPSHFYFVVELTKTVQLVADVLLGAAVNGSDFSCLGFAGKTLAPAKDRNIFYCTKIGHKLATEKAP